MYPDNPLTGPAGLALPRTYTGLHISQGTVSSLQSNMYCNVISCHDIATASSREQTRVDGRAGVHGRAHQSSDSIRVSQMEGRRTIQDVKKFQRTYPNHK